jgi:hypothetical protein
MEYWARGDRGCRWCKCYLRIVSSSNLLAIQHLLVCGHFNMVEGLIINDHQIQGRQILWRLQLRKSIATLHVVGLRRGLARE